MCWISVDGGGEGVVGVNDRDCMNVAHFVTQLLVPLIIAIMQHGTKPLYYNAIISEFI